MTASPHPRWPAEATAVLDPGGHGTLRVLGGPGTGKTSLLADAAAAHVRAGLHPGSVLVLTGAGPMPASARTALTRALLRAGGDAVIAEPAVRTVHSYAFAVLRRAAERAGDPPPRLVTGAEQDGIIRELLAGDLADGAGRWPGVLTPALPTAGFADELSDLLARCAERGVDPAALQRIGRQHRRPEWVAAGRFARQYEQVMRLRAAVGTAAPQATMPTLGAAELVGAALVAFAADPELLAAERARITLLLVDDAQQLDPQAARLVRVLAAGARRTLLAGDPDQAVFGFRGADPAALLGADTPAVRLTVSQRCAPAVAAAITAVADKLPGRRHPVTGCGTEPGAVNVRAAVSEHAEAALIADTLRRAHLVDKLAWSQMAVIVRSVPLVAGALARALTTAGVPVALPATTGALAEHPAVAALLTVLHTAADRLDAERAVRLLTGPIGRIDPVSLRALRRALRRSADDPTADSDALLVAALRAGPPADVPAALARPLRRVRAALDHATRSAAAGEDPRHTLWQAWHHSGLQRRWLTVAERGGALGVQADRDLAAVTALFDVAEQYVSRTGAATVAGLLEFVAALRLPTGADTGPSGEAVRLVSAHAALGHEWDLVVVAGLQDGLWPNTVPRGGVLGTQRLLDVLDGVPEHASVRALLVAEERRLLVAAMGRARRRVLVTAVDGAGAGGDDAAVPSPFFTELADSGKDPAADDAGPVSAPRVLSASAVVGRLRALVCAPAGVIDDAARSRAATQLARLARAKVPGADPATWPAMTPLSTTEPLLPAGAGHTVTLSPSTLGILTDCPLRWLAERHGGRDRDTGELRSTIGSMLHALAAETGRTEAALHAELEQAWTRLPFGSAWYAANELDRHREMLAAFLQWRANSRSRYTEIGVEVDLDGLLEEPSAAGPGIRLRGRIDRVERDEAGRPVIVDLKTGRSPVSKDQAQQHAQLAAYQLAVSAGLLAPNVDPDAEPGGARLVYLGKPGAGGPIEREQDPLTPEAAQQWRERARAAAAATTGPQFIARVNDGCDHCPIRSTCPAHRDVR